MMEEAAATRMLIQLRHLFTIILETCHMGYQQTIWEAHELQNYSNTITHTMPLHNNQTQLYNIYYYID